VSSTIPAPGYSEPLILYHGTNAVFDRFIPSATGAEGPGIYLSDAYSLYGDFCLKTKVVMTNPFFFYPSDESLEAPANGELIEQVLSSELAAFVNERLDREGLIGYGYEVQEALKARGHDGIIMVYPFGEPVLPGVTGSAVVIAFESDQVEILGVVPTQVVQSPRRHKRDEDSLSL
jgi:hypothetical protein